MTRRALVLPVLLALVLPAACDWSGDPVARTDPSEIAYQNRMKEGRNAFIQQGCTQCHVIDADDFAAKDGPDMTYYNSKRSRDSTYAKLVLDPTSDQPKDYKDHPKVADQTIRNQIGQWLGQGQELKGYVSPRHDRSIKLGDLATCPVTGLEVVRADALSSSYGGKTYYFPTPSAQRKFDSHQDHYANK